MTEETENQTSTSSIVHAYIKGFHEQGHPHITVSSVELADLLGVSRGATSGYLSRMASMGVAEVTGRKGHAFVYSIDTKAVAELNYRVRPTPGGSPGRKSSPTRRDVPLSREELADALLSLATKALEMPVPLDLASIPTKDLMAELAKRVQ